MKKTFALLIVAVAIIIGIFYVFNTEEKNEDVAVNDYKNASYIVDGTSVQLVNGMSEVEAAPGSASKVTTMYFGNEVEKDLDGDGTKDVVFLLTQNTGGSGTFFYVVAALNTPDGYKGSSAVLLGDHIAPQSTESGAGKSIIINYLDRTHTDPMTAQPSVGKSIGLLLDPATMQFGEVATDFEGEANPSQMSLTMKTWKWEKAVFSDGKVVQPKKDVFTVSFKSDGTFSATTDCNSMGGKYVSTKDTITLSDIFSTKMYCEGSQESEYASLFDKTSHYLFTSKGELVLLLKYDSGSVYFK